MAEGRPDSGRQLLSIVVPAYNEEDNVVPVFERLHEVLGPLDLRWELIFAVDPCTDRTEQRIAELRERDQRVKMLRFSRRVGQPMATLAGMEAAAGDAVVVIDCDLQDPPELITEMVARWRSGFDVVYAQRRSRKGETVPKRMVASLGYRLIKRIAEVQVQHGNTLEDHGRKLDEIAKALEPLARIDAFMQLVAGDHEKRISDLERHTNI